MKAEIEPGQKRIRGIVFPARPAPALASMGQGVALEVDAAALPSGAENLRDGGFDALMSIADDQLHAPQAPPRQLAEELSPNRLGLGSAYFQTQNLTAAACHRARTGGAFDGRLLTPMARMTATETIRPPRRTLR